MRTILKLLSRRYPGPGSTCKEGTPAATTANLVSMEQYLRSDYEPDRIHFAMNEIESLLD